jgi:hypothetical protein
MTNDKSCDCCWVDKIQALVWIANQQRSGEAMYVLLYEVMKAAAGSAKAAAVHHSLK